MAEVSIKNIAQNRKARHEYEILDTYETGLVLSGTEVKSLRLGKVQLADSYAVIEAGELWLYHMHITPYEHGSIFNHEPARKRKLLMHKQELRKLYARAVERGLTLVPLRIYFKGKVAKIELALVRGKKLHDKREAISNRDARREIDRNLKERRQ
ncbi:MAG: SsrA-binding protein SmpB [candidate division Zixibacteria bacterium]|nr:SsrA-binding protein SmpB [candidate division Zixibacteria bacterium]